jgi:hypothetical protein
MGVHARTWLFATRMSSNDPKLHLGNTITLAANTKTEIDFQFEHSKL